MDIERRIEVCRNLYGAGIFKYFRITDSNLLATPHPSAVASTSGSTCPITVGMWPHFGN